MIIILLLIIIIVFYFNLVVARFKMNQGPPNFTVDNNPAAFSDR